MAVGESGEVLVYVGGVVEAFEEEVHAAAAQAPVAALQPIHALPLFLLLLLLLPLRALHSQSPTSA